MSHRRACAFPRAAKMAAFPVRSGYEHIKARQREGIVAAKARGGRPIPQASRGPAGLGEWKAVGADSCALTILVSVFGLCFVPM
jgi:hypothetical protein